VNQCPAVARGLGHLVLGAVLENGCPKANPGGVWEAVLVLAYTPDAEATFL